MVVSCWLMVGPRNGRVRVWRILYHGRRVRAGTLKPSNESKSAVADCRCQEGSSEPSKLGRRPSRHRHPTGSCLVARTRKAAFAASRNFTKKQRRAERKTTGKESARCEVRGCEYRLAGGRGRQSRPVLSAWCLVLGAEEEFEISYVARRPDGVCNRSAAKCKSRLANREHCEHWNWDVEFGQLVLNLSQKIQGGLLRLGADGLADKTVRHLSVICLDGLIIFFTNF